MHHAPPTFIWVALLGVVATTVGIDVLSVLLHSSWIVPLGILLGAVLTLIVLLLGPWKTALWEAVRGTAQEFSRGEAAWSFVSSGIPVGFLGYFLGTREMGDICAQQVSCSVGVLFGLTVLGLFLSFLTLSWLFVGLLAWERLRRRDSSPESR